MQNTDTEYPKHIVIDSFKNKLPLYNPLIPSSHNIFFMESTPYYFSTLVIYPYIE